MLNQLKLSFIIYFMKKLLICAVIYFLPLLPWGYSSYDLGDGNRFQSFLNLPNTQPMAAERL